MQLLNLLKQRRVWSAILSLIASGLAFMSIDLELDVDFLENAFTNLFSALSALVGAVLALTSYFCPKNDNS